MNKNKYNEELVLRFLKIEEIAKVEDMAYSLNLSTSTIRRILTRLEEKNLVKRNWGGVTLNNKQTPSLIYTNEAVFIKRKSIYSDSKHQISKECAKLLQIPQKIFICCGTTTSLVPQYVTKIPLNFITNNLEIIKNAERLHEYTMLAGDYDHNHGSVNGTLTLESIEKIYANTSVLTCSGISIKTGITSDSKNEALIISKMIDHTIDQVIMLIDSSKFEKTSHYQFAQLSQINTIITDNNISPQTIANYKDQGINIIIA